MWVLWLIRLLSFKKMALGLCSCFIFLSHCIWFILLLLNTLPTLSSALECIKHRCFLFDFTYRFLKSLCEARCSGSARLYIGSAWLNLSQCLPRQWAQTSQKLWHLTTQEVIWLVWYLHVNFFRRHQCHKHREVNFRDSLAEVTLSRQPATAVTQSGHTHLIMQNSKP